MDERLPRKLVAILYADVANYSRLTGVNEDTTHRALGEYLDLISETINTYHGEVMHYAGDAVLAKFEAVIDSVSSATEIQEQLLTRNANLPEEQKVQFRIGVNLGDVIEDRGDIYGDGVNIAARLESAADPGGVCVSASVFEQIRGKLDFQLEDMGEQEFKNIAEPVRAFRIVMDRESPRFSVAKVSALELPDKPSIAVLPFTNMSSDPEQEYFSDGITEDIITALSRISMLLVVARHSTMAYKGQAVDIKQVGREQGVRYVLEGSVRKGVNRVRVTGQLIDASTGHHLWAERYDRKLDDIFTVQDEITQAVTLEMQVQLTEGEQARLRARGTGSVEAREAWMRADELTGRHIREDNLKGRRLAEKASRLDPHYAYAWVAIGYTHWVDAYWGWGESLKVSLEQAMEAAQKALDIDETHPDTFALLGLIHLFRAEHDKAVQMAEKGAYLAPGHADAQAICAHTLNGSNKPKEAIRRCKRAMRLCPIYPAWYLLLLGDSYRLMDKQDLAIRTLKDAVEREPDSALTTVLLANVLAGAELLDEAKVAAEKVLSIDPTFTLTGGLAGICFYKDPALNEKVLENLRKAGLPE
jgi:adenylate cyclase